MKMETLVVSMEVLSSDGKTLARSEYDLSAMFETLKDADLTDLHNRLQSEVFGKAEIKMEENLRKK